MKTIKIIDLINDLFDYRETQPNKLPKKIRFNGNEFNYKDKSYYDKNDFNFMRYINHTLDLRVEAEIIEEEKEIEPLTKLGNYKVNTGDDFLDKVLTNINERINHLIDKQTELIDKVNELNKENK